MIQLPGVDSCPVRRKSDISPTGDRICGSPHANVITEIPMKDRQGNLFPQLGYTCLECSVRIASWKFTQNLAAWEKANPRRIITAG